MRVGSAIPNRCGGRGAARAVGLLTLLFSFSFCRTSRAVEVDELYRSPRLMAMGGAGIALVESEEALFLNPAGLAADTGIDLHAAILDLELSSDWVTEYLAGTLTVPSAIEDILSVAMNKNISLRASLSPTLTLEGLGIAGIGDQRLAFRLTNETLPQVDLLFQQTYGFQVGYGLSLGNPFGGRGRRQPEIRVGIGWKQLTRRGGWRSLDTIEAFTLNQAKVLELSGAWGSGTAFDGGVQYSTWINDEYRLHLGASLENLGGLTFSGGDADPIEQNFSAGFALTRPFKTSRFVLAYDWRHVFDDIDWRKKSHLGLGVQTPVFGLSAGLNQGFICYGGYVDVWLLRVSAATTTEETATLVGQNPEGRWTARIDLKLDL